MAAVAPEIDELEMVYAIIEPHFDAVRDFFAEYVPPNATADVERGLLRVHETKLIVSDSVRNSPRHYAACRDDGLLIVIAPEAARLPLDTLVAMISHEFGHAADFLYPGMWFGSRTEPAQWAPWPAKKRARMRRIWSERSDDQVEWDADSIAWAVTGKQIEYCGSCLLQCFAGGRPRPKGLR